MKFSKFFSNLQEAPWYRSFLNPVINEVDTKGKLLDIGTGSGKMIQILSDEKGIDCIGVDKNAEMIKEANNKLKDSNVKIIEIEVNKKLPFEDHSFNYVTICSVLFHLNTKNKSLMLEDSMRLLKENGKLIVLTPTGKGNFFSLTKNFFSFKNLSIYIWFYATRSRAKLWNIENYLKEYSEKNNVNYSSQIVMKGFAQLEVITV
jgi:ubiquinone/menaquinone biosynthesis C-methylase UbiE